MIRSIGTAVLSAILMTGPAAGATRVFVASSGSDTNPCSRALPCRTFAQATTAVSPGGEIVALDTAGFGPFTVASSVSIYAAPGAVASISIPLNGVGIQVSAGSFDTIDIRGLFIGGAGGTETGVNVNGGGSIEVEGVTFAAVARGISTTLPIGSGLQLVVADSAFFDGAYGIFNLASSSTLLLSVRGSRFEHESSTAIAAGDSTYAIVTDSRFVNDGVAIFPSGNAEVTVERCAFRENGDALEALNTGAVIRVAHSIIGGSTTALTAAGGGVIATQGPRPTNTIDDAGTFASSYNAQ